jgi:hypothetical protein
VTLESRECTARNNTFRITAPVPETLFTDGCYTPVPGTPEATFQLDNGGVSRRAPSSRPRFSPGRSSWRPSPRSG